MVRIWGSIEAPRLQLQDFDTDKYKCIAAQINVDGQVAFALMSQNADPPHYRVVCGVHSVFFTQRKEALDYMSQFKCSEKIEERGRKS